MNKMKSVLIFGTVVFAATTILITTGCGSQTPASVTAPAPAPATTNVVYTCPMHSEIVSNAPGNCPICGMQLVPKK